MNILDRAIEILQTEGWVRGSYHNAGGYCMMGALNESCAQRLLSTHEWSHCIDLVEVIVQRRPGIPVARAVDFNDHIALDVDEVIGVLKLASEEYERELELMKS